MHELFSFISWDRISFFYIQKLEIKTKEYSKRHLLHWVKNDLFIKEVMPDGNVNRLFEQLVATETI